MNIKRIFFFFALITVQVILSFFIWSALMEKIAFKKFTANAFVGGIPVKGMNFDQAMRALQKAYPSPADHTIIIAAGEKELPVNLAGLDSRYLYPEALNEVARRQRPGRTPAELNRALKNLVTGSSYGLFLEIDKNMLAGKLDELNRLYARKPVDARIDFQNGEVLIIPEEYGRTIDRQATIRKFSELRAPLPDRLEAVITLLRPQIQARDLAGFKYILGEFETVYDQEQKDRANNILVAATALDNTIIQPEQVLSFNEKIGRVTLENGYRLAPVIKDDHYDLDYGGGICQVSTTIYNAARLAGLEIVEKHPHAIPVPYVENGQDATVAMGVLDLKIKNPYSAPVYLSCRAEDGRVAVKILGKTPAGKRKPGS